MRKRRSNLVWTIGSTVATAGVMYTIAPLWATGLCILVLLTHEFGHYLLAYGVGGDPATPVLIPILIGAIGVTRVRKLSSLSSRKRRYLFLAGPTAGTAVAIALLPVAIVLRSPSLTSALSLAMLFELASGTVGSDGKRWRKENHS